jgi:hypothetical protein
MATRYFEDRILFLDEMSVDVTSSWEESPRFLTDELRFSK